MNIPTKLISMLALTFMLAWIMPITAQAGAPSVRDCLENMENCEPVEGEDSPETNTEETPSEQQNDQTSTGSTNLFLNFVKLIVALAIVLALIYFLSKLANRKNKLFQKNSTLESLGGITLGAQKSMQVVRIGQRFYVVGVGDNIELLTEVTDEKTIADLMDRNETSELDPATLVTSLFSKKRNQHQNTEKGTDKEDFSAHFKKELNGLKSRRKQSISRYMDKGDKGNE